MSKADAIISLGDGADITSTDTPSATDITVSQIFAPPPTVECALSFSAVPENVFALSAETVRLHLLFEIKRTGSPVNANGITGFDRLPINVALVIDCSSSMEGQPIEKARQACSDVIDLLEPGDYLTIVTFADQAEVIIPARRVTNKNASKDHLAKIVLGNRTNLYEGLAAAYQQISAVKSERTVNRLILLSDGAPSAGAKDFSTIIGQVAVQKSRGITTSTIGLGPDYNEELIATLARRVGGNYYHVVTPAGLQQAFLSEVGSMKQVVARNLRLKVHLARGVNVRQVHGHQPIFGNRSAEITLGDVDHVQGISSLWELEITHRIAGNYRIARAELVYDDAATGWCERLTAETNIDFTTDEDAVNTNVNAAIVSEVEVAESVRSLDRTMIEVQTNGLATPLAVQELDRTKNMLLSRGHTLNADIISETIDRIQSGVSVKKALMETTFKLDQGKIH
jgi:Ca-activated chloride channel family protein